MKGGESRAPRKPFSKIAWSWLGAFVRIYLVSILNHFLFLDNSNHIFFIGSFGASAVLIYAVPQAELSQPRNLIGGHIFSALIGISLFKVFASRYCNSIRIGSIYISISNAFYTYNASSRWSNRTYCSHW